MKNILILIIIAGLSSSAVHASASTTNMAADFLYDVAIKELKKGDVPDAVHELKKALMINPFHTSAKEKLKELGVKEDDIAHVDTYENKIAELNQDIEVYQNRLYQVQNERQDLKDKIDQLELANNNLYRLNARKENQVNSLKDKLYTVKRKYDYQETMYSSEVKDVKDMYKSENEALRTSVERQDTILKNQNRTLHEQEDELSDLRNRPDRSLDVPSHYEEEMARLNYKYNRLREENFSRRAHQHDMYNALSEYITVRRDEMNEINDQLIAKEIKLLNHEEILLAKLNELVDLRENANQYYDNWEKTSASIEDRDRSISHLISIIHEKEFEIKELKGSIESLIKQREKIIQEIREKNLN